MPPIDHLEAPDRLIGGTAVATSVANAAPTIIRLDASLPALQPAHVDPGLASARVYWVRRVLALVLGDLIALFAIIPLAVWAAGIFRGSPGPALSGRPWLLIVPFLAVPVLGMLGLYGHRWRLNQTVTLEYSRVLLGLSVSGFLALLFLHATNLEDRVLLDGEVFALWFLGLLVLTVTRGAMRRFVLPRISGRQRTVIIGAGEIGQRIARSLERDQSLGIDVVGFIDTDPHPLTDDVLHIPVLGPESHLVDLVRRAGAHRVIISFSRSTPETLIQIIRESDLHRLHVTVVPRLFEVLPTRVEPDTVGGMTVLDVCPTGLSRGALAVKRVADLALVALSLPLLVPLFAAVALAVRLDSPGPVLFRQPRAGRRGRVFDIFKFRTMVVGAEQLRDGLLDHNEVTGPLFKIKDDPRVTRLGRFLRRTSLDELPQLLNVVRGDMSLVGPRPFVVYEDEAITGWARRRLDLTPGITGLWQVMGRNDMPFEEMVKLDHLYVTRWSLAWDMKILLQTIPSVLRRRGAY